MNNPIIVVGRPRSGSTLFTRLLNESQDLCIVNDFYYLQYVDSLGGFNHQNTHLLKDMARQIFVTLKDRYKPDYSGNAGIECAQFLTLNREKKLKNFIKKSLNQPDHNWSSLFGSIMQYCASLFGKKQWGYNTPQDYLHLPRLQEAFPQAKFIFVMRDPRAVLCSFKYLDYLEGYHEPAGYHPVLQAIAWKSAMKSFLKNQHQDNVFLVKYEDLISNVNQVLGDVGDFVGSKFPQVNLSNFGSNSTFKNKQKNELTATEIWICERIARREMQLAGYTPQNRRPSFKDVGNMLYLTNRSLKFYCQKSLISADTRKRLLSLAKARLIENS